MGAARQQPLCRPAAGIVPSAVAVFVATLLAICCQPVLGSGSHPSESTKSRSLFAIDPDLMIRSIDPRAPDNMWAVGEGWGFRPFFFRSRLPGLYDRVDFLYPLGCYEDTYFRNKLRLTPFFESRWSKEPPHEGFSRCLTLYRGRSDLGQDYWGFFPFYGRMYRRFGVDHNRFVLFPLYYESTDDGARTFRFLWPLVTYANNHSRSTLKVWPIYGHDRIRNDYNNLFVLWPFFQVVHKYPGTEQASRYSALPFPLYVKHEDSYSCAVHVIWPLFTYYHHYQTGHQRYSFRPFITYGTGGGIEELSLLSLYTYKRDHRHPGTSKDSSGYVSVAGDEIVTERSFLSLSSIKKRYRKGCLTYARYRFWPLAEYIWDAEKGSRLKVPEIVPLNDQWWDLNMGRLLRFVDFRDTPITREVSLLFGWTQKTELKSVAHIAAPPVPGDDDWGELVQGAFGKQ